MPTRFYTREEVISAPLPTHPRFKDLTGLRVGKIHVLCFAGKKIKTNVRMWFCECDCGKIVLRAGSSIRKTNGCKNCYQIKHGLTGGIEFTAWQLAKGRCNNPKNRDYYNYGARGIVVCERWQHSFEAFLSDMGCRPSPKHSLDRINSDGPYSPDNCRWATQRQQANNQRTNRLITIDGKTDTLANWCGGSQTARYGRAADRLSTRWCARCAITQPKGGRCHHKGKGGNS